VNPDQEPVGLVPRHHAGPRVTEIEQLQEEFPGFRIWQEATGERTRLVAVRRQHGTSPHTVVTADLTELRAVLDSHRHTPARS
jgi:hypothetical protein